VRNSPGDEPCGWEEVWTVPVEKSNIPIRDVSSGDSF